MNKSWLLLTLLPMGLLTACSDSTSDGTIDGRFKATIPGRNIDVAVACRNFKSGEDSLDFVFASDAGNGVADTNDDGIIIWGSRIKIGKDKSPIPMDGVSLDVVLDGEIYSIGSAITTLKQKQDWTLTPTGIKGKDQLQNEKDSKYPITYEVICE